jgi:uncharacterized protein YciI
MSKNLFAVILTYTVPLDKIDEVRPQHLQFLDEYYKQGIFIASGPQVPRTGGVIIACAESKEILEKILHQDPYAIRKAAQYQIYEFSANKYTPLLNSLFLSNND